MASNIIYFRNADTQHILEQLTALTTSGVLDAETAQLRAYKLRTEISQLRSRLGALPPVNLKAIAQLYPFPNFGATYQNQNVALFPRIHPRN
jgi:hypothetical protein